MRIITENLSYTYSEKSKALAVQALKDISLTIEEGEFFGIVGKTGSGKSTLIQHFNGLIPLGKNNGKIIVGDIDLSQKKPDYKKLRANVGMVFQYPEYQLFAETIEEDVAFGLKNFLPNISEQEKKQLVKNAINAVGLDYEKVKDKSPFELSGGQKRRVAIAGVIVTRPQVLVLDEPAAGLDPKGKREFLALLKQLHADFVKTIIIVSHDMNLVSEHCTSVAIMKDGKIIKKGSPKEIFTDKKIIEQADLELPLTAHLTNVLKEKGINVENNLTVEDFIKSVKKAFERQKDGGEKNL